MTEAGSLEERYRKIGAEIRAVSPHATLIAVSKTQPADAIEALYRLGHRDFGENYVQELIPKAQELEARGCAGIRWHFIGHLQTNKVKQLIPWIFSVHTLDSERLARELAKRWRDSGRTGKLEAFVEVNIDDEDSKSGIPASEAPAFTQLIAGSYSGELSLSGLMCIPAADKSEAESRGSFQKLRNLEKSCQPATQGFLSMGMSSDYLLALSEGSTHVRVGTALFGKRALGTFG